MAEGDCWICGARVRHQRPVTRRCLRCNDVFRVMSERSRKEHCSRACYAETYNERRRRS